MRKPLRVVSAFLLSTGLVSTSLPADVLFPAHVSQKRLATEVLWKAVRETDSAARPHVVLILGGGGAKGLAHIGVLRVFEEEKIPIDEILGVSVGALIGALYAGGLPLSEIETMAQEVGWNKLTDLSKARMLNLVLNDELLSTRRMEEYLNRHIGEKSFSDLRIPFTCVATDLRNGERVVFKEGSVALAARASATIPGIFEPVEYRQRFLVDGGLVDNLPTEMVDNNGSVVIGVLPQSDTKLIRDYTIFGALIRSIEIQKDVIIDQKKSRADFIIEPDVGTVSLLDLSRSKECIEAGISAAQKKALGIKRHIIRRVLKKYGHHRIKDR